MNLEVRDRVNKTWKQKLWSWWEMEVVATVPRAAVEVAMVPAAGSVGKYAWCSVGGDNDWLLWQLCSSSCAAAAVTTAWHCCSGGVMLWLLFRVAAAVVTIARSCTGWLMLWTGRQNKECYWNCKAILRLKVEVWQQSEVVNYAMQNLFSEVDAFVYYETDFF